ncbi:DEKNAAC100754 [Brettanomyces naardenensis]|uniref:DEKNAAC100754 n=1 Tax=Brettanomyces naardenensis TaxID=13370 RepID=A0A448YFF9_BRENA|nr:DEKNAAC100754 [Brettanomyces naardenensis]
MMQVPPFVLLACGVTCFVSLLISTAAICLHLTNYRKLFEQRLIVRILLVVPMFAVTCYISLLNYSVGLFFEPIREIYEAFVIYTFYKLLVLLLGGERAIIRQAQNKPPTSHFFPVNVVLGSIDISDPKHFLTIKRCILQYVWVKPLLYISIGVSSALGYYDVNDVSLTSVYFWLGIVYNISVTISLYYLALFWKCLYEELKRFNPWPKFLCVKVIIFASYWQGLFIGVLNWLGVFRENMSDEPGTNPGIQIQNALLCLEMIFFAWMHWVSFRHTEFTSDKLPDSARVKTWNALKDWVSMGDLVYDLRITTMYGDSYNFRNFDSVNDVHVYNESETFNKKIYQGLRVSRDGSKYWIPGIGDASSHKKSSSISSSSKQANSITYQSLLLPNQSTPLIVESAKKKYTPQYYEDSESIRSNSRDMQRTDSFGSSISDSESSENLASEDFARDEKLYQFVKHHYITEAKINYPVEYDYSEIEYSSKISKMRQRLGIQKKVQTHNDTQEQQEQHYLDYSSIV